MYLAYFPSEHTRRGILPPVYVRLDTPLALADAVLNGAKDVSADELSWRAWRQCRRHFGRQSPDLLTGDALNLYTWYATQGARS